jgi:hypothetical protein
MDLSWVQQRFETVGRMPPYMVQSLLIVPEFQSKIHQIMLLDQSVSEIVEKVKIGLEILNKKRKFFKVLKIMPYNDEYPIEGILTDPLEGEKQFRMMIQFPQRDDWFLLFWSNIEWTGERRELLVTYYGQPLVNFKRPPILIRGGYLSPTPLVFLS